MADAQPDMLALSPVPFGSLRSLEADELTPISAAIDATNCFIDDGGITGRNGYRATTSSAVGSGTVQGAWRFRPTTSVAWALEARNGNLYSITDPSSETATDGSITTVASSLFGTGDAISGAQLGAFFYLGTDNSAKTWQRVRNNAGSAAVQALAQLGKGTTPTSSFGSVAFTKFVLGTFTTAGGASVGASGITDWINVSGTIGGTATYDIGADANLTGYAYLMIACSPESQSGGGGQFSIGVSTSGGGVETLVSNVYDTPGGDSPYVVFCPLAGLSSTTRKAVRKIVFKQLTNTDPFSVSGYMAIPTAQLGPVKYYVTFYNSSTGQESVPTDIVTVQQSPATLVLPQFHAARWHYNALADIGTVSSNPDTMDNSAMFNKGGGLVVPTAGDLGSVNILSGTILSSGTFDKVRLWRLTSTGYRIVRELGTNTGTTNDQSPSYTDGTNYVIYDDLGDSVLAQQLYLAGGTPPPCVALASRGGRLICGGDPSHPNRVTISSYVPINTSTEGTSSDPMAQFPAIPVLDSDGWAFDISPTAAEQVLNISNGDALYIATNQSVYTMNDLTPNSPPFLAFQKGIVGRRAAMFAEGATHGGQYGYHIASGAYFFAAPDGIYQITNRWQVDELTGPIRRLYASWFIPDTTTVLSYQDRKLYAVTGTRMLRYDFVTQTWTRHNLAHTFVGAMAYRDPAPTLLQERMWFVESANGKVMRWQPGTSTSDSNRATSDAGTSISAWTYSTGFAMEGQKTRLRSIYADVTGSTTVTAYKDTGTSHGPPSKTFSSSGEHEYAIAPNFTGYKWRIVLTAANTIRVKRLMMQREPVSAHGG